MYKAWMWYKEGENTSVCYHIVGIVLSLWNFLCSLASFSYLRSTNLPSLYPNYPSTPARPFIIPATHQPNPSSSYSPTPFTLFFLADSDATQPCALIFFVILCSKLFESGAQFRFTTLFFSLLLSICIHRASLLYHYPTLSILFFLSRFRAPFYSNRLPAKNLAGQANGKREIKKKVVMGVGSKSARLSDHRKRGRRQLGTIDKCRRRVIFQGLAPWFLFPSPLVFVTLYIHILYVIFFFLLHLLWFLILVLFSILTSRQNRLPIDSCLPVFLLFTDVERKGKKKYIYWMFEVNFMLRKDQTSQYIIKTLRKFIIIS